MEKLLDILRTVIIVVTLHFMAFILSLPPQDQNDLTKHPTITMIVISIMICSCDFLMFIVDNCEEE